jgi:hypothetical protein
VRRPDGGRGLSDGCSCKNLVQWNGEVTRGLVAVSLGVGVPSGRPYVGVLRVGVLPGAQASGRSAGGGGLSGVLLGGAQVSGGFG